MAIFYLDQLRDEPETETLKRLSPATITLCLAGLVLAERDYNWQQGIEGLSEEEWAEARTYLWAAINQLTGEPATIDGGSA